MWDFQEEIPDICFNLVEFHDLDLKVNPIGRDSSLTFTFVNLFKTWRPYGLLHFIPSLGVKLLQLKNIGPNTCWFLFRVTQRGQLIFWFLLVWISNVSFSFHSDVSLGEKRTLVKSVSDPDARLLVVLPKGVSPTLPHPNVLLDDHCQRFFDMFLLHFQFQS